MSQPKLQDSLLAAERLPSGWTWDCIGNHVADFVGGCSPTKRDYAASGFLVLNKGNIKPYGVIAFKEERKYVPSRYADQFADRFIKHSDLVVTLRDLSQKADFLGLIGIFRESEDALLTQGAYLIRLKPGIKDKYLIYYSNSPAYRSLAKKSKHGSTQVHLRNGDFLGFSIPIAPPDEQRRIVAEIEKQFTRLEAGVAALRRVQANLKRYRAAVLKAACEGRLVPTEAALQKLADKGEQGFESGDKLLKRILFERSQNWQGRGKYKEPAAADTADLPPLPDGWTWASLEQLSVSSSYGTSAKCSYENEGPPVLRIPNISNGRIDLADLKFAGASETIAKGEELRPGDLIIIRTNGSRSLIGRSAVVREELDRPTDFASYLIRFRLIQEPILFGWIGAVWDSSFLRAWIEQRAATSAGQHNISMSVLATLPVPLPPLAEQTRIVAEVERRLSVVEELESVVTANLQRATRLRQSILQKAFTGELC